MVSNVHDEREEEKNNNNNQEGWIKFLFYLPFRAVKNVINWLFSQNDQIEFRISGEEFKTQF